MLGSIGPWGSFFNLAKNLLIAAVVVAAFATRRSAGATRELRLGIAASAALLVVNSLSFVWNAGTLVWSEPLLPALYWSSYGACVQIALITGCVSLAMWRIHRDLEPHATESRLRRTALAVRAAGSSTALLVVGLMPIAWSEVGNSMLGGSGPAWVSIPPFIGYVVLLALITVAYVFQQVRYVRRVLREHSA